MLLGGLLVVLAMAVVALYRNEIKKWRYEKLTTSALLTKAQQNPQDIILLEVAGERLLSEGLNDSLKPILLPTARKHPENATLTVLAARIALEEGDLQQAGELLKQALQAEPNHPDALFWSAQQLYRRGRKQMAEQLLIQVTQIEPERSDAWIEIGEIALEAQDYVTALKHFDHAEKIRPTAQSHRLRAQTLFSLGRQEEAETAARAALKSDTSAVSYTLLGRILQNSPENSNGNEAQKALETALLLDPKNTDLMKSLAITYRAAEKHQDAIKVLRRMIRLAPAMSEGYLLLSQSYQASGQREKATQVLKIFQYLTPIQKRADAARHRVIIERGSLASQLAQVKVLLELGRQDLARDVLERAWAKAPNNAEIKRLARLAEGPITIRIPPLPPDPTNDTP